MRWVLGLRLSTPRHVRDPYREPARRISAWTRPALGAKSAPYFNYRAPESTILTKNPPSGPASGGCAPRSFPGSRLVRAFRGQNCSASEHLACARTRQGCWAPGPAGPRPALASAAEPIQTPHPLSEPVVGFSYTPPPRCKEDRHPLHQADSVLALSGLGTVLAFLTINIQRAPTPCQIEDTKREGTGSSESEAVEELCEGARRLGRTSSGRRISGAEHLAFAKKKARKQLTPITSGPLRILPDLGLVGDRGFEPRTQSV